jgi:hypothetical protein
MSDAVLEQIREIIQRDVNGRGLAADPNENLLSWCHSDFAESCRRLATIDPPEIAIITGFFIPAAQAAETDGPLGALFLARILHRLSMKVTLLTEAHSRHALEVALRESQLNRVVGLSGLADDEFGPGLEAFLVQNAFMAMVFIERPGPNHDPDSVAGQLRDGSAPIDAFVMKVPGEHWNQHHTMSGRIIDHDIYPLAYCLEEGTWHDLKGPTEFTIGIGDGGNEIGMGKIPWEVIAKNIPNGHLIACRVPTDYNIVCGVSNWGAYGLAAGVWHLRGMKFDEELFSPERERTLWEKVLQEAVLVDGVTGQRTLTVDGLAWDDYIQPLREIGEVLKKHSP